MVKTSKDVLDYYKAPEHYSFFGTGNKFAQRFIRNKSIPLIDALLSEEQTGNWELDFLS